MLQSLTLYGSRDVPIGSYSKGMRQRIVLISALMHDPELLILDEPSAGLDVTSALVLRRVIARLAEQGKAVLFSSPVLEQVDKLCSHLVVVEFSGRGGTYALRAGALAVFCRAAARWVPQNPAHLPGARVPQQFPDVVPDPVLRI
jgi:ABC-type uncharacterized transport system ATPase subunit